ncbi:MAG: hypothetical protein K6F35_08460 [Lachnospiraceae bacterium]|nr:hypothetical protein [Lachnospiraceae bacterium]
MEAAWIAEYRRETDRNRRKEILNRVGEDQGETEEYLIRKELYDARYHKQNGQDVDHFIRGWIDLQSLKRRVYLPGEKKRIRKELDGILQCWQFPLCRKHGEAGEKALYDELFNLTYFYMELCERDKMYNAVLLGLGHITDERRTDKIAAEIREMTVQIPEKLEIQEEFSPFIKAARDAFLARFPAESGKL